MDPGAPARFTDENPSVAGYFRAIVLFGRNVASYKFALAEALLELGSGNELVPLDELALPFATRIADHLHRHDRQGTSARSRLLDACRSYNRGEIDVEELRERTVRLGFQNVIDAFHIVDGSETAERFFVDERSASGGIRLTDNLRELVTGADGSLTEEVRSRWRLVETAWELNLPRTLLTVAYEPREETIIVPRRRTAITSARGALNGYQKGHCFYCYAPISIDANTPSLAHVDHVFAWSFGDTVGGAPVDGVWNLVLACQRCNGWHEKADRPPAGKYVQRLHRRNEYLVSSHHPLRPTLLGQTGETASERAATLRKAQEEVTAAGGRTTWEAPEELKPGF